MSYFSTTSGRLLNLAAGIALTGGGLAALVGHGTGVVLMCASLLATIVTTIWSVAFGSEEAPGAAILTIAVGPWLFFLLALGVGVSMEYMPSAGYGMALFGLLALARAAFGAHKASAPAFEQVHA